MLKKLVKYEIIATSRFFLFSYAALIVLSVLNRLLWSSELIASMIENVGFLRPLLSSLSILLYVVMICVIIIGCIYIMSQRFKKNMFGDEGYLMHTLPVRPWQHIVAKSLVSTMWLLINTALIFISISILIWAMPDLPKFFDVATTAVVEAGGSPVLFYSEVTLAMLIWLATFMLPNYTAVTIGTLWKKHRKLGEALAAIGMMVVLYSALFMAVRFLHELVFRADEQMSFNSVFSVIMIALIVLMLIGSVFCFFIINFVLKRKLNLE